MAVGIGTDIVSVDRIARLIATKGDVFLQRWFTAGEIAYCRGMAHPDQHFAARLAAKESVFKALRCTWDGPIQWRCAEVIHVDDGVPAIRLSGSLLERAQSAGVGAIHVSLSHCAEYATAFAVAEPGVVGDPAT